MAYTLATAAEAAKVSKPTVFRWIKKGLISATRTDAGEYRIDPAELQRYLDSVSKEAPPSETTQQSVTAHDADVTPIDTLPEAVVLRYEVEKLKELLEMERRRANELRQERDRWAAQAERLALAPPQPASVPAAPRGFWKKLFG
jgi:excisionase family DNA binding protein